MLCIVLVYNIIVEFGKEYIVELLKETCRLIDWPDQIELLLVGGAAAMLGDLLPPSRVTQDCDVMNYAPLEAQNAVLNAARQVAHGRGLPENWLNFQAMSLNVLPDGWKSRRVYIGTFGRVSIYAAGRIDLLCMKFYANRPQDREDIVAIKPTMDELEYIRKYLDMLKLPSRLADLDQVESAVTLLNAIKGLSDES